MEKEEKRRISGIKIGHIIAIGSILTILLIYSFSQFINYETSGVYECKSFSESMERELKQFYSIPDYVDVEFICHSECFFAADEISNYVMFYINEENYHLLKAYILNYEDSGMRVSFESTKYDYDWLATINNVDYGFKGSIVNAYGSHDIMVYEDIYNDDGDMIVIIAKEGNRFGLGWQYRTDKRSVYHLMGYEI